MINIFFIVSSILPGTLIFLTLYYVGKTFKVERESLLGLSIFFYSLSNVFVFLRLEDLIDFYDITLRSSVFNNLFLLIGIFYSILIYNTNLKKRYSVNSILFFFLIVSMLIIILSYFTSMSNYLTLLFFLLIIFFSADEIYRFFRISYTYLLRNIFLINFSFFGIFLHKNIMFINFIYAISGVLFSLLTLIYYIELEKKQALFRSFARDSLDRAKKDIISIIGHEIRTPLIAISGYIDLLGRERFGTLNDLQQEKIGIIRKSTEDLCKKIDAIIEFSNLQLDEENKLDTEIIPLKMVIENLISIYKKKNAHRKEIYFDLFFPEKEIFIKTNQTYLHQVLTIIMDNSLKFSKETLRITITLDMNDDIYHICIQDNGIGVDEDKIDYIFNDFFQENSSSNRKFNGLGLGLSLAKKIIKKLNGEIKVSSKKGHSFTVDLYFPINIEHPSNML